MKKFLFYLFLLAALAAVLFLGRLLLFPDSGKPDAGRQTPETPVRADAAETLLASMTLPEKVGQMFLARCPTGEAAAGNVAEIQALHLGGYVLFADFFADKTTESAIETLTAYQNASKTPLLIATDEEGGDIVRVSKFPAFRDAPFDSPQTLYAEGGLTRAVADAREKAALLLSLGVNLNLAPVADVSEDAGSYMYPRTLGQPAGETAEYVRAVVTAMKQAGLGSALKHFPGYGNNNDTHGKAAVDDRAYEELARSDFLPFIAGIDAGADCVLVSHLVVSCLDAKRPASLSPAVHDLLRDTFLFEGVILTDDLDMEAVAAGLTPAEAAEAAVLAGNDLICTGQYAVQIPAVVAAVEAGRIPAATIDAAVLRILRLKQSLGLL